MRPRLLLKRLILLLFLLMAVSTTVFFLTRTLPGNPALLLVPQGGSAPDMQQLKQNLNLDKPLIYQYLNFQWNLLTLDLGTSFRNSQPVLQTIRAVLPRTLALAFFSLVLALTCAFAAGSWAAFRPNTGIDAAITLLSSIGAAIPNFLLGPLLILLFAITLHWLPVSGDNGFKYIILPTLTLAASMCAGLTRVITHAISSEMNKPYVLTVHAMGLKRFRIFYSTVLKNAMLPVITNIGLNMGALLCGTVITETIFSWKGIGHLLVTAIKQRDYPMVQGIVIFISFIYLGLSLLVDISYYFLDPRITHDTSSTHI